jgi:hypothetical protein
VVALTACGLSVDIAGSTPIGGDTEQSRQTERQPSPCAWKVRHAAVGQALGASSSVFCRGGDAPEAHHIGSNGQSVATTWQTQAGPARLARSKWWTGAGEACTGIWGRKRSMGGPARESVLAGTWACSGRVGPSGTGGQVGSDKKKRILDFFTLFP